MYFSKSLVQPVVLIARLLVGRPCFVVAGLVGSVVATAASRVSVCCPSSVAVPTYVVVVAAVPT